MGLHPFFTQLILPADVAMLQRVHNATLVQDVEDAAAADEHAAALMRAFFEGETNEAVLMRRFADARTASSKRQAPPGPHPVR